MFDSSIFDIYAVNVDFKGSKYYLNASDKDLNERMKEDLSVLSGSIDISTKRRISNSVNIGPFLGYQYQWINQSRENYNNSETSWGIGLILGKRIGPNFEFKADKTYYCDKNIQPTYGFYFGINDKI